MVSVNTKTFIRQNKNLNSEFNESKIDSFSEHSILNERLARSNSNELLSDNCQSILKKLNGFKLLGCPGNNGLF